jgi:hypothetical protein
LATRGRNTPKLTIKIEKTNGGFKVHWVLRGRTFSDPTWRRWNHFYIWENTSLKPLLKYITVYLSGNSETLQYLLLEWNIKFTK